MGYPGLDHQQGDEELFSKKNKKGVVTFFKYQGSEKIDFEK